MYCVLCIAILKTDKKGFALVFGLGFLSWGEFLRLGVEGGGGSYYNLNTFLNLYYDYFLTFNFLSTLELVKKFVWWVPVCKPTLVLCFGPNQALD